MIKGKCGELELPFDDIKQLAEDIGNKAYRQSRSTKSEFDEIILIALINSGYFAVPEDDEIKSEL